jgi:ribonuclease P protein component
VHSREIKHILGNGRPQHGDHVVVFLAPGSGNVAVIAGNRVGGAVQRNRAKRVLRAAWAEVSPRVVDRDAVLVARATIGGSSTGELVDELTRFVAEVEHA